MERFFQAVEEGDYRQALELANKIVAAQPDQPTGYELRSTVEYALGLDEKANEDAAWPHSVDSNKPKTPAKRTDEKAKITNKRAPKVANR
jgi:hypothetical protein